MLSATEANRSKYTVRTSDRRTFRRCLRKWDLQSSLKQNLTKVGTEQNINFWFGSGIHFAMEDFHGYNAFKDPRRAFNAYFNAFDKDSLPEGAEYCYSLGMSMLSYYLTWLPKHNDRTGFETAWFDDEYNVVTANSPGSRPGVEISFNIPLNVSVITDMVTDKVYAVFTTEPIAEGEVVDYITGYLSFHDSTYSRGTIDSEGKVAVDDVGIQRIYYWTDKTTEHSSEVKIVPMFYHGTIDRIVVDRLGRLWLLDYKTAKGADTNKLDTDDQITSYLWACTKFLKVPVYGFIYLQLTKDMVQEPKRLKNGDLSVDKKQKTTYSLVRQAIFEDYGTPNNAPAKLVDFLNTMAENESPEGDRFIRWDFVLRSPEQIDSMYENIIGELNMMLNPYLHPYPNPTRDCIWDCPFRDMCIAIDRKDDVLIKSQMVQWTERPRNEDGNIDPWRKDIHYPASVDELTPLEDILDYAKCMQIELHSNEEDSSGFKFAFETEDD